MTKPPKEPEWRIQHYVVRELHQLGILYHADQNAGKRGPKARMISKATGMRKGWPDLTIVHTQILFIEFKVTGNKLSKDQEELHDQLTNQGLPVYTVTASTGEDAWKQVAGILGL